MFTAAAIALGVLALYLAVRFTLARLFPKDAP